MFSYNKKIYKKCVYNYMALGSSYVCVGRYLVKATSRARVCSPSFGGMSRVNFTPDVIWQTYGKEFTVPAGLPGVPASLVGQVQKNRYIPNWDNLWGADANNKTNIMRALSGLCFQVEDRVLKNPSAVSVLYAGAQDSGILNNDFYNQWWRMFSQGGVAGSNSFFIEKQFNYKKSSSDDSIFKWGPYLGKYVQVNQWIPVTYDDVTKEIKISGRMSNITFGSLNGTPFKHPVAGNTGVNGGAINNYYDRGNLYANAWNDHVNRSYAWGQTFNYKVFPGTGFTTDEVARSVVDNYTNSISNTNLYL